MAKTNAQRQREKRKRQREAGIAERNAALAARNRRRFRTDPSGRRVRGLERGLLDTSSKRSLAPRL